MCLAAVTGFTLYVEKKDIIPELPITQLYIMPVVVHCNMTQLDKSI